MKTNLFLVVALAMVLTLSACGQMKHLNATKPEPTAPSAAYIPPSPSFMDSIRKLYPDEPPIVDPNMPKTTILFDNMEHDFGHIKEADGQVRWTFAFKNTGKNPLVITSAKGSCGCTVADYSKTPVAPGARGTIQVEFNPKGKSGIQTKTVTIQANTDPNPTRLTIKADIERVVREETEENEENKMDWNAIDDTTTLPSPTQPPLDYSTDYPDPGMPLTKILFEDLSHDFGNIIEQKGKVTHTFTFRNTGNEPLVIYSAKGSCGCIVPNYPIQPIAPGAKGSITVEFDPKGKSGFQTKTVTIQANTDPNPTRLTIKADVKKSGD